VFTASPVSFPAKVSLFLARFLLLNVGLAIYGLALALAYRARLGLHSWGIFQTALTHYLPFTYGQMTIIVGAVLIAVASIGRIPPGIGTLCNMAFIGLWLDACIRLLPEPHSLTARGALLLLSLPVLGIASALYLRAGLGAGPRDAFMLAVMRWTGWRVRTARGVIEITVFAIGLALSRSEVGIGTVLLTFAIGPVVDSALHLFRAIPTTAPSPDLSPATAGERSLDEQRYG
jgi:uncharacterized membrane protein YczE